MASASLKNNGQQISFFRQRNEALLNFAIFINFVLNLNTIRHSVKGKKYRKSLGTKKVLKYSAGSNSEDSFQSLQKILWTK
jgi:hypothetical protein